MRQLVVIVFAAVFMAAPSLAKTWSLNELMDIGLQNSKQIKAVEEERTKLNAQIKEYYGKALPSVDLSANYQYAFAQYSPFTSGSSSGGMGGASFSGIVSQYQGTEPGAYALAQGVDMAFAQFADFSKFIKDQTAAVSLSLKQTLFAQGKVSIGLKIAKLGRDNLETRHQWVTDSTRALIAKMFYGALLTKKSELALGESVQLNKEMYKLAVLRFTIGKTNELDTLMACMNYERSIMDHKNIQTAKRVQYLALIKQAEIAETYETFDIDGEFPIESYFITFDEAQPKMQEKNSSLAQLKRLGTIQDHLVRLAYTDFLPLAYCGASVGKTTQFNADDDITWYNDRKVFAGISWNLFNGFQNSQKIVQAKSDRENFKNTLRMVTDGMEIGLRNACETLSNAKDNLSSAQAMVNFADRAYTVAKRGYENGLQTMTDLQNAELGLKNAKLGLHKAQFAYYSAVIDVKLLINEL